MQIEDLDGNVLRIGSDNRIDQPIGEWLDMYGGRWVKSPKGWMDARRILRLVHLIIISS